MSGEERKATDVLLDIENEVKKLTQTMSSLMLAHTLSLDKLNHVYNYISNLEKEIEAEEALQNGAKAMNNLPVQSAITPPIEVDVSPVGIRRTARQPEVVDEVKISSTGEKKVPVMQRVTTPGPDNVGKDLFMADVRIMNEQKELVAKIKTNSIGKWQAHLAPGKYDVHIVKTDTATKTKIEAMQSITIPNSHGTITLPIVVIKKRD